MDRFDAAEWLRLVERHRVRWAYLVPTMMSRILALPDEVREAADVSSLEIVMHMAAPCPPWVKQAWIDWIGPEAIWEIYAGTEGYGATMINGVEWLEHRGSVGLAPPRTEVRDDDGNVLPPGEDGTIHFYPPDGNPMGHTDEARTYGDVGHIDEDGYLYLADRRTDMILTGGVNLYPAEIEGAIEQYPGVVAAAVIGLADPDLGARPTPSSSCSRAPVPSTPPTSRRSSNRCCRGTRSPTPTSSPPPHCATKRGSSAGSASGTNGRRPPPAGTSGSADPAVHRSRWRIRGAKILFVAVVATQVVMAVNGYRDPHKFFAFQPFNESSTWQADIVRVTTGGDRVPIDESWSGYDWNSLVDMAALQNPQQLRHAYMGVGATLDFLGEALDWVADNTPDDHDTVYLEATVTYFENTDGPHHVVLRTDERERG